MDASSGAALVTLYGGTAPASGSCSFSVNVIGIAAGQQGNVSSPVYSNEGGLGNSAGASITVTPASSPTSFCVASVGDLQTALSTAASNGAVNDIRVRSGVYSLASPLFYLATNTEVTTLSGGWDSTCAVQASDPQATVFDAGGLQQIFGYSSTVPANLALQNLTLRNGKSATYGGGLYINTLGSLQLQEVNVETCLAGSTGHYAGGGIWVQQASSLFITGSTFSGNQAQEGAAVAINQMHSGTVLIQDTVFDSNQSLGTQSGDGTSAVAVWDFSSPPIAAFTIIGSIFRNGTGHAVNVDASVMTVDGSLFVNNTDTQLSGAVPQVECGLFGGAPTPSYPVGNGRLLIENSVFQGTGAFNAGCMTATASSQGKTGAPVDSVVIRGSMFSGFTAGVFPLNYGGRIPLPELQASNCVLRGNTFSNNSGGSAVVPDCTSLAVSHNRFLANAGASGSPGALYVYLGNGFEVDDNLFWANQGSSNGGAVDLDLIVQGAGTLYPLPTGTYVFTNNTFVGNQAPGYGGGLSIQSQFGSSPTIQLWNNLFWSNTAGAGFGSDIYFDDDHLQDFNVTQITLYNNAYVQSTAGYYVRVPVAPLGSGNLTASDPHFINAVEGDFRLGIGSPMSDVGNNAAPGLDSVDLGHLPRVVNGTIDVGAFEFNGDEIFESGFGHPSS